MISDSIFHSKAKTAKLRYTTTHTFQVRKSAHMRAVRKIIKKTFRKTMANDVLQQRHLKIEY